MILTFSFIVAFVPGPRDKGTQHLFTFPPAHIFLSRALVFVLSFLYLASFDMVEAAIAKLPDGGWELENLPMSPNDPAWSSIATKCGLSAHEIGLLQNWRREQPLAPDDMKSPMSGVAAAPAAEDHAHEAEEPLCSFWAEKGEELLALLWFGVSVLIPGGFYGLQVAAGESYSYLLRSVASSASGALVSCLVTFARMPELASSKLTRLHTAIWVCTCCIVLLFLFTTPVHTTSLSLFLASLVGLGYGYILSAWQAGAAQHNARPWGLWERPPCALCNPVAPSASIGPAAAVELTASEADMVRGAGHLPRGSAIPAGSRRSRRTKTATSLAAAAVPATVPEEEPEPGATATHTPAPATVKVSSCDCCFFTKRSNTAAAAATVQTSTATATEAFVTVQAGDECKNIVATTSTGAATVAITSPVVVITPPASAAEATVPPAVATAAATGSSSSSSSVTATMMPRAKTYVSVTELFNTAPHDLEAGAEDEDEDDAPVIVASGRKFNVPALNLDRNAALQTMAKKTGESS